MKRLFSGLAPMDWLAIVQVAYGVAYVVWNLTQGDGSDGIWFTGHSLAFGGVSTKLAYETVNPKLRAGDGSPSLMDRLARRGQ